MRLGAERNIGLATAAIVSLACASHGHATSIGDMVGRWGGNDSAYDCTAQAGTETQYVEVAKADGKIFVGAYAWGCFVEAFKPLGVMLAGEGVCSEEGGDGQSNPIYDATIIIGLTPEDKLVLANDSNVTVLNRCPKAH